MISRLFCSIKPIRPRFFSLDIATYHRIADHTLDHLYESIEQVLEDNEETDTSLSMGVLTIKLGKSGTFVMNKQPPNLQIWLSSPLSGPKRFDFDETVKSWIYKRDGSTLSSVLNKELSGILNRPVNISIPSIK